MKNSRKMVLIALVSGAIATAMVTFNTELGRYTNTNFSSLMNHLVNLGLSYFILAIGFRNPMIRPHRGDCPWYMYLGGLLGILNLTLHAFAVNGAGTTVLMVGAIFGQSLLGLVYDLTGFLGMEKRKLTRRNVISISISLVGVLTMLWGGTFELKFLLIAICSGFIAMTQMVMGGMVGKARGVFHATRTGVLVGAIGMVLLSIFVFPGDIREGFSLVGTFPFAILVGGGVLAIGCGLGSTYITPRMPAVIAQLAIATGQLSSALIVDYFLYDRFSFPMLLGVIIMMAGMVFGGEKNSK